MKCVNYPAPIRPFIVYRKIGDFFEVEYIGEGSQTSLVTLGKQGKREVCKPNKPEYENKITIIEPAVNRVEKRFTPQPTPVVPRKSESYSGGTGCRDGWVSHSTGRGTCSHHGGIDR